MAGSKEQTARRPARSLTHSSASSQPAEKIHPLKLVDGTGVEYMFLEVQGPSGLLLLSGGPLSVLTLSFAPFRHSGHKIHVDFFVNLKSSGIFSNFFTCRSPVAFFVSEIMPTNPKFQISTPHEQSSSQTFLDASNYHIKTSKWEFEGTRPSVSD